MKRAKMNEKIPLKEINVALHNEYDILYEFGYINKEL